MIGTLITGAIAGLLFYYMGKGFSKIQHNIKRNSIEKRLASGTVGRMDLYLILSYYSNPKNETSKGIEYVQLSENHYPEDRELNEAIFNYYMETQNYQKAMEKIDKLYDMFPDNPNVLFGKGYCCYKLNEYEKAEEYRQKAILLDISLINKEYK